MIRQKVKNNAGGVANHNMFWEIMEPNPNSEIRNPKQNLMIQIQKDFGNFDTFKEKFSAVALGHFGSGWAWVVVNDGKLEISDSSNQDSTISYSLSPILCLDVWEHAYYLKYKNMRAEYIAAFWSIVNWKEVERRFGEGSRI
ncbi:MAG: Manganese/iron superoxide dismutase [Candidatus Woesebacteria bacterium GW2011_GWA2_40_7]|uniref:superoxide dismutase n=1 Tax=Candidatus Woesebacteria bacterium GW2011_GWA2_40_7 TaxID=1618562 RepID=A0A0G0TFS2_9BACT|nr:MAG: Manganese/iron superoxide dismutase [Candidatus Woesebacteria bacterium GW2011_GWA2_40_7]